MNLDLLLEWAFLRNMDLAHFLLFGCMATNCDVHGFMMKQGDRKDLASGMEPVPVLALFKTSEVQKGFHVFPRISANSFKVRNPLQLLK